MATNAEQIQTDLLLCNVTMWNPEDIEDVQLNIGALIQAELAVDIKIASITAAADALLDIEDIATGDTGISDVQFIREPSNNSPYAWSMIPRDNGTLSFFVNTTSSFYKNYIVPSVDVLDVPLQHDLGEGLVDKSEDLLRREREQFLSTNYTATIDVTIVGLGVLKTLLNTKKVNLEALYA